MIAPHGQKISPAGLEPPAGARKATVKIRRNPSPWFIRLDPYNLHERET